MQKRLWIGIAQASAVASAPMQTLKRSEVGGLFVAFRCYLPYSCADSFVTLLHKNLILHGYSNLARLNLGPGRLRVPG